MPKEKKPEVPMIPLDLYTKLEVKYNFLLDQFTTLGADLITFAKSNRIVRDNEYGEYELSVVSGRTDLPAWENEGYFEVAIIKIEDTDGMGTDKEILILGTMCNFEEVYKIQKKFREDPRKLWNKTYKKEHRRR